MTNTLIQSAPPLADPRTPKLAIPTGSCDSHCHIFGPFDRYPLPEERSFTPPSAPETALRHWHERFGFARSVIVQSQGHGYDHRPLLDALRVGGGRYKGVALVRATDSDEVIAAYDEAGVCGARFHFLAHLGGRPDLDAIRQVATRVKPFGWHLAIHVAGDNIVEHAAFIESLDVPVVIDHMARPDIATGPEGAAIATLRRLMDTGRVWVKLSGADRLSRTGAPFHDALPIARSIAAHAPERVLWGSDWPHVNLHGPMPDDGDLVDLIADIVPDEAARRLLLIDNPVEFFGFE
ncbi:amidohydrolase family protein [Paraburkholderia agricolaris]|uniref:amidohydrolase family protein n=1 Tax=Paraburkholderia agricolaris TaxID=2152888 RepID=UPI001291A9D5|nr:amidohydrolase family protein [Paraburkholderia agricolaris]